MELITATNSNFDKLRDELIENSFASPNYCSQHMNYYKSVYGGTIIMDFSSIITDDTGYPLIGFLAYKFEINNNLIINYFGQPGIFVWSEKIAVPSVNLSIKLLADALLKNGLLKEIKNTNFELNLSLNFNNTIAPFLLQIFLKESNSHTLNFEQVIDLSLDEQILINNFSKSAKSELKKSSKSTHETIFYNRFSDPVEIKKSVEKMRELHFASAGRVTRSEKSWQIQEQQISMGSILLVHGIYNSIITHSSFFLLSHAKAFYGVSANLIKDKNSTSHFFIIESLFYLKSIGIKKLYMGKQFEHLNGSKDLKIDNIAMFKSFFGGTLIPTVTLIKS